MNRKRPCGRRRRAEAEEVRDYAARSARYGPLAAAFFGGSVQRHDAILVRSPACLNPRLE